VGIQARDDTILRIACAGLFDRDVRRGADDLRGSVGVSRAALGYASEGLQEQDILFGQHGVSNSELVSPVIWRDSGCLLASMLRRFDFRMFSKIGKNGFILRSGCFIAARS
jgi:hypothetical protein